MTLSRRAALTQLMLAGFINALLGHFSSASAETATYTYDALGRVTRVVYSDGTTIDYTYDPAGNRTQVVKATPPPPPITPGTVVFDSSTAGAWTWTATATQNFDIEVWGPGAGGSPGTMAGDPKYGYYDIPAPGGGGGGYCLRQFAVISGNNLGGRIGAGGAASGDGSEASTLASYQSVTLTAGRGLASGSGGSASGGTSNVNGRGASMVNITDGGGAGNGGGDQTTPNATGTTPGGAGAGGAGAGQNGGAGRNGRVLITAR